MRPGDTRAPWMPPVKLVLVGCGAVARSYYAPALTRLVAGGWEGNVNVKWLRRVEALDGPAMTRWETARYTDLMPDGKARQFTFVMDAKSVITSRLVAPTPLSATALKP